MQIVGIDASLTCTGICTFAEPYIIGVLRSVTSNPASGLEGRIKRYQEAACGVTSHMFGPVIHVFIEGYSFGSPFKATPIAEYGGILRQALLRTCASVIEVAPAAVKKFATGKGNAPKGLVQAHVARRWNVICDNDDECDSYVLARIGLAYHGLAECDNEAQREVIERLKNPPVKKSKKRRVAHAD